MIKRFWIIMSFLGCLFLMADKTNACPPIADIDCDAYYNETTDEYETVVGVTVNFDGSDSQDSASENGYKIVAHEWIFPAEAYNISGEDVTAKCKFFPASPAETPYVVTLKVTDDEGLTDTATVDVKVTSASSAIWYVKPNGDDDNDGQSGENAFQSIQVGISSAAETETVIVEEGVYHGNIDFHGGNRDVTVKSTDPDDPAVVANTVIDSVGLASVVTFEGSETSDCELTGFTIRDGGLKDYDPSADDPISHWALDESGGTTATNSVVDGPDGELKNMDDTVCWVPSRDCKNGLEFDGGNDYVSVANHGSLNFDDDDSFTICLWMKADYDAPPSTNVSLVSKYGAGGSGGGAGGVELDWYFIAINEDTDKLRIILRDSGGDSDDRVSSVGVLDHDYHHVALVRDLGSSRVYLYVDGSVDIDRPLAATGEISPSNVLTISAKEKYLEEGQHLHFDGTIDDVRIYNRALSAHEISELADIREPIGHWRLDQSSGTSATDSSDNANNGTLTDFATPPPSPWVTGKFGNALDFDPTDPEDYVDLGSDESLKHPLPLTMSAWIYRDTTGKQAIICLDDESSVHYGLTLLVNNGDYLQAVLGDGTGGGPENRRWKIGTSILSTETWWHVAVVAKTYTDIQLYVNGANDGGTNYGTGGDIAYSASGHATIGVRSGGTVDFFDGKIDDVRVYDKALSEKEINQLYRGGGGIYGNDTQATISKCIIADNRALEGGGIKGVAGTISACKIEENLAEYFGGGGLLNISVSPTVDDCEFTSNVSFAGGGMYNVSCSPTVTDCTFTTNYALYGGGMSNINTSSPTVTDCEFTDNEAVYWGGGMENYVSSSPTITGCTFSQNTAPDGGGMYNYSSSSPAVTDCEFTDNEAVYWGGGMENHVSSSPTITRCIFAGNTVTGTNYAGGAIYCGSNSDADIVNCTISKNAVANGYAGGLCSYASSPTITNTIFWDNTDNYSNLDLIPVTSGTITLSYCDVTLNYYTGGGSVTVSDCMFGVNPEFANSATYDFHLQSTSECIDAGDPSSTYSEEPEPNGDRINMGAYGNTGDATQTSKYQLVVYLDTDDEAALSSDAQWLLEGYDSTWRNSAEAVLVDSDNYTIKCRCDSGTNYIAPDDLNITVGEGQPTSYTRTYEACGYIIYVCYYYNDYGIYTGSPDVGWRVVGESEWKNGQKKYVPGNYVVEFKSVAEHDTPSNTNVTVTKGSSNSGQSKGYQRTRFYVDGDNGNNSNKGGKYNSYETIQYAFNIVPDDGEIYVEQLSSGDYEEAITFPTSKDVYIRAVSAPTIYVRGWHNPWPMPGNITAAIMYFSRE